MKYAYYGCFILPFCFLENKLSGRGAVKAHFSPSAILFQQELLRQRIWIQALNLLQGETVKSGVHLLIQGSQKFSG